MEIKTLVKIICSVIVNIFLIHILTIGLQKIPLMRLSQNAVIYNIITVLLIMAVFIFYRLIALAACTSLYSHAYEITICGCTAMFCFTAYYPDNIFINTVLVSGITYFTIIGITALTAKILLCLCNKNIISSMNCLFLPEMINLIIGSVIFLKSPAAKKDSYREYAAGEKKYYQRLLSVYIITSCIIIAANLFLLVYKKSI